MSGAAENLTSYLQGLVGEEVPANVALMQLLIRAQAPEDVAIALAGALRRARSEARHHDVAQIEAIERLRHNRPDAWRLVRSGLFDHGQQAASPDEALSHFASRFDQIAIESPETGVALYSLGDPQLLAAATTEIADDLRARGLTGPDRRVLDLGCGSGRLLQALAPQVRSIDGIDLSGEMIKHAALRCGAFPNIKVAQCSGKDLSLFAADSFDLIVAVDVFPYLFQAGKAIVESNFAEAARVLVRRGKLVIFNLAYGLDSASQRRESERLAQASGLVVVEKGTRRFKLWDGTTFVFEKPGDNELADAAR